MCRGTAQQRQQLGQVPGFRRRKLLTQVGRQSLLRALIYVGFGAPSLDKRCFLQSIRMLFEFGAMSEVDVTTQLTARGAESCMLYETLQTADRNVA